MSKINQISPANFAYLVRNANNPDIPHFDALMHSMFGQRGTVVKIFGRLLRWLPYSVRADGSVYKSNRELGIETACSEKSVARARKALEEVGFEVYLKKANGAPTNHYRLDVGKLLAKLATIFGTTVAQIKMWMWSEPPAKMAVENAMPQCPEQTGQDVPIQRYQDVPFQNDIMSQSITIKDDTKNKTTENDKKQTTDPVVVEDFSDEIREISEKVKTDQQTVTKWVGKYGMERVSLVVSEGEKQVSAGKIKKTLGAWVSAALRHNYRFETKTNTADKNDGRRYISGADAAWIEY